LRVLQAASRRDDAGKVGGDGSGNPSESAARNE